MKPCLIDLHVHGFGVTVPRLRHQRDDQPCLIYLLPPHLFGCGERAGGGVLPAANVSEWVSKHRSGGGCGGELRGGRGCGGGGGGAGAGGAGGAGGGAFMEDMET